MPITKKQHDDIDTVLYQAVMSYAGYGEGYDELILTEPFQALERVYDMLTAHTLKAEVEAFVAKEERELKKSGQQFANRPAYVKALLEKNANRYKTFRQYFELF